jgi:hypothetical protein
MPEKMAAKRTWITPEAQVKRVKVITVAIIIGACLGPLSLLMTVFGGAPPTPFIPPDPAYLSQATAVVTSWIEGRPSPIPTSETVSKNLGRDEGKKRDRLPITNVAWSSFERETGFSDPKYFIETHSFTAVMDKQLVVIEVPIATQGDGPVLVALPSIVPSRFLPGPQKIPFSLEPYGELTSLTAGGRTQIEEWAKAYGKNDKEALYRLTGDPEQNTYLGIPTGNYVLLGSPIIGQVVTPYGADRQRITNTLLVRIQVKYAQPYTQQDADEVLAAEGESAARNIKIGEPNPAKTLTLEFDLLLTETDRTLPFISAWGTAGNGPSLVPYANATLFAPTETGGGTGSTTSTTTASGTTQTQNEPTLESIQAGTSGTTDPNSPPTATPSGDSEG